MSVQRTAANRARGMTDSEALKNTRFGPNPEFRGKPWGYEKGTPQNSAVYYGRARRGSIPSGGTETPGERNAGPNVGGQPRARGRRA